MYLQQVIKTDVVGATTSVNLINLHLKHSNANQWLDTFEKKCERFDIIDGSTQIEILRLFLDKSFSDWHPATLTILTIEAEWSEWKERILESFVDNGWGPDMYAIYYRYKEVSLIEYAIRKEKLLLDMDNAICSKSLVLRIAAGLPEFVRNKIDKENSVNSTALLHEIRKC